MQKDPKQKKNIFSKNKGVAKKMVDALSDGMAAWGANKDCVEPYKTKVYNAR